MYLKQGDSLTKGFAIAIASLDVFENKYYSTRASILEHVGYSHREYTFSNAAPYLNSTIYPIPFENLSWLFQCNPSNRGIILQDFDEAAYLYSIAKSISSAKVVEIGRYKGGATFLLVAATDKNSSVLSIDLQTEEITKTGLSGKELDEQLKKVLQKYSLSEKVKIEVADSHTYSFADGSYDLVFIDGDHSYEGVKKDYDHWKYAVKEGKHLFFHDAGNGRPYSTCHTGVAKLISEIEKNDFAYFKKASVVGSIVHFVKTEKCFERALNGVLVNIKS